jgi:L-malate glycosyltransferase
MKYNVLHIVTGFADGGLEKVVLMLASNIRNPKITHHAVSLLERENEFLENEFVKSGVNPVYFDFDNRITGIKSTFKFISGLFRLARYIKTKNINIIHSHDFFPALTARLAAVVSFIFYFHKVNNIYITLHNQFFWLSRTHHFINRLLSIITTKIICVSQAVKEYSLKNDKINSSKYMVIYNGVETGKYTPDAKYRDVYKNEFNMDGIIIGNIGVLSVRKGQKYLLAALKNLLDKNHNLKLLIFGSERAHEKDIADEIYSMISKLNLSNRIRIIPPRKDINLIYNVFDIFVMPSVTEGLSLSAIEAMLMKRICLFSDIEPFKEMIEDGKNGFLFKSGDIGDLSCKLEYIIENLSNLSYISENARNTALQRYDVLRMCREYESIYLN